MDKIFSWDEFEKEIKHVMDIMEKNKVFDIGYKLKKNACLSTAANLFFIVPGLVLANLPDKARECAELGLTYVKYAKETGDRNDIDNTLDADHADYSLAYIEYYLSWFMTGVEDCDLLETSLKKLILTASRFKQKRKLKEYRDALLQLTIIATKAFQLDTAIGVLNNIMDSKLVSATDIIPYTEERMLKFIVDTLISQNNNDTFVQSTFNTFFREVRLGNPYLFNGYVTITDISEVAFIYYKYFSADDKLILKNPVKIIRSIRYET